MFGIFKKNKKTPVITVDESIEKAIEDFWCFFRGQSPLLLSIARRFDDMEEIEEKNITKVLMDKAVEDFSAVTDEILQQLWQMIPQIEGKLDFDPNPGELVNGKFDIFVSATKDCLPVKDSLIQSMPADIKDNWEIVDLDEA